MLCGAFPAEDGRDHAETAGVDFRHAGLTGGVFLEVDAEHAGCPAVEGGERGLADLGHARVGEELAESRASTRCRSAGSRRQNS